MTSHIGGLFGGTKPNFDAPQNFWDGNTFNIPGLENVGAPTGFPSHPLAPPSGTSSPGLPAPSVQNGTFAGGMPPYAGGVFAAPSNFAPIGGLFGDQEIGFGPAFGMNPFALDNLADEASRSKPFLRGLVR
jgi:hypothetical protein